MHKNTIKTNDVTASTQQEDPNQKRSLVADNPTLVSSIRPDEYERKLAERLNAGAVAATQLLFEESCHSVAEAASAVGGSADDFVKNICLIARTDCGPKFVIAIVPGARRASRSRVQNELRNIGVLTQVLPEPAHYNDILSFTGYPPGGTPSFCYDRTDIIVLVDVRIQEKQGILYTGGGSERSLCKLTSEELVRASGGKLANISDRAK